MSKCIMAAHREISTNKLKKKLGTIQVHVITAFWGEIIKIQKNINCNLVVRGGRFHYFFNIFIAKVIFSK